MLVLSNGLMNTKQLTFPRPLLLILFGVWQRLLHDWKWQPGSVRINFIPLVENVIESKIQTILDGSGLEVYAVYCNTSSSPAR